MVVLLVLAILIGLFLISVLSFFILLILKNGIHFFILKCPNCKKRGVLRRQWKFSTKKENKRAEDTIIDAEIVKGNEKRLLCRKCNYEVVLH